MKAKIDSKHRLQIPKAIWDECNFVESEFVDVTCDKFGSLIVTASSKEDPMPRILYVDRLHGIKEEGITAKKFCKSIVKEFGCIVQLKKVTNNNVEFAAVCTPDIAQILKERYR